MASEPFIGEIILFAGNFAPQGWAFCDGQLLDLSQNTALFSILGNIYGGDGRTNFGLPDLRGRVPIGARRGGGLSERRPGERGGRETSFITESNLPEHSHTISINAATEGNTDLPTGNVIAGNGVNSFGTTSDTILSSGTTGPTGLNTPITNMQPFLGINFIIALVGVYPSRS